MMTVDFLLQAVRAIRPTYMHGASSMLRWPPPWLDLVQIKQVVNFWCQNQMRNSLACNQIVKWSEKALIMGYNSSALRRQSEWVNNVLQMQPSVKCT